MAAHVSSSRRSPWQGKRGPARAGSPHHSAAKESEQVTSLLSPLRPTSHTHRVLRSQDGPFSAEPTQGDAILPSIVLIFNSEEEIQRL